MFQILIVALLPGSVVALDTFDPPVAITNARIVVGDGSVIERGTILIEEGRIKAVGAGVNVPAGADRLDVEGAFVYPGFVDAHSFVGIPNKPRTPEERQRTEDQTPDRRQGPPAETDAALRRGVRAHLRAEELFAPSESDLESFRKSGITTVLVAPRSGVLAGRSAWIELSGLPLRRALLRSEVAQHASFDVGEPGDYPNSLLGVFALFRQTLLDARWYVQMEKYAARHPSSAPRTPRDTVLEALQPLLARSVPLVFEANEENEILRALNLAAEFNLKPMISGAKEAYRLVDRLKNERVDLIVSLKFDEEPEYGKDKQAEQRRKERQKQEAAATQPEDEKKVEKEKREEERSDEKKIYEPLKIRQERRRIWEEHVANIIKLHEAGIPFALSTREFEKPAELLEHLRKVIQRGLPEEAALAALTRTPAGMFGLQEQLGTIAAGRLANLTILDKPLADEKSKTQWVFIEGKKFQVDLGRKEKKSNDRNEPRMNADERGSDASQAEESPPETQAALAAASQPSDEGPSWRSEIEADRVPPTHTGGNVLIRNGTLLTVTHGILPNTSILIRDGKIREMGRDIQAPEGVTVIDATGRFVSPGLIDCHSHMAIDAVNESALSVSAEVRIADVVNNRRVPIYRALAGGITTTHAMHGSANPIGGQNTIFKLKYNRPVSEMLLASAPRTVKFALGENVIQSNWQDAWGKRFPNTRMGVEGTIRRAFTAAREYSREWADYRAKAAAGQDAPPLRRDLRLEALSEILAGDITVHCHCYRADEILRLLDIAETFGIRVGVLHHVLEGYRIAPEIARHGCGASTFANMWAYKVEAFNAVPYNAALLTRQGICTTVNSDSSNTIRFMNLEAAKSLRWGNLDQTEALRLVTLNAAIQLQIDNRVGSLDISKDGDVAIWNGHPLNAFSKCVMTLIEGEVYFENPSGEAPPGATALNLEVPKLRSVQKGTDHETDVRGSAGASPSLDNMAGLPPLPTSDYGIYAIVGATVHPVSGPAIERGTVVIMNGRIDAVGAGLAPPPKAGVIDGRGLHVYPGLIDGGGTLGLFEIGSLRATQDSSDIARFEPDLRAYSAYNPHSVHVPIARAAGFTMALVRPVGGTICGQAALLQLDGWTAAEALVSEPVALFMRIPSLPIHLPEKDREKLTKEHKKQMQEIEDYLKRAKLYAQAVERAGENSANLPPADLALDALIPYVRSKDPQRIFFFASDYKHILDTLEFAQKQGLSIGIAGGAEAWKLADNLGEKKIPVLFDSVTSYPSSDFEAFDSVYSSPGILARAGVPLAFASGSAADVYNLPFEAGMAVAHGLPEEQAIYALTLGAAQVFGIENQYGSLDPGKAADVIVTTGSPLQPAAHVEYMFIRGRPIELDNKQREDCLKFARRPAPDLPSGRNDLKGPTSMSGR